MLLLAGMDDETARLVGFDTRDHHARVADVDDMEKHLVEGKRYDAVFLGPDLADPVVAVRRVKARAPDLPVLILAPAERCARIQHQLLLTALPGDPPRCVTLGAQAHLVIESHLTRAKLRRRHSAALRETSAEAAAATMPRAKPLIRPPPVVERFLDAVPVGILLTDPEGRIHHRNRLARDLTGAEARVASLSTALPGASATTLRRLLSHPHERPRARIRLQDGKGRERHFDATSAPAEIGGGPPLILVTLDEVTSLVEAERRLEETRAAVTEVDKLATMGSLVGGLAHEIRTPLTAIMNNVSLIETLARRGADPATPNRPESLTQLADRAAEVSDNVERIRRLVKDLNRFMRRERPEKRQFVLSEPVAEAARLFEAAHRGHVVIETRLDARGTILADDAQVQQMVLNLLQNAAEASPSGGVVRVETADEDGSVLLRVTDQGPGIPLEVQSRLFEAFVTTKPQGTGLGLSIVRRLVELHGARVSFDTQEGRGTTFTIAFPRVA